jgi:quercetin dioxygenase-like cupin family protein
MKNMSKEILMLTRRDVLIALVAACTTLGIVALAQSEKPVMKSAVWDWNAMEAKPNKAGEVRRVFQGPTATLDELECHITTLKRGESPHPPHKHPDEELIIVKEGTVESTLEGKTYVLGPGSIILQASNEMHGIRNVGKTPATYHVIKWNSPGMLKAKQKN